jgi:hypothetical protein
MAQDKKSFLLYVDIIHTVRKLTNEQSGQLFKHVLAYVNDENPETSDPIIDLVFEPIKQQLKRDLKKYESIKILRSNAGKASAAKKEEIKHKSTHVNKCEQEATNSTVNVNDNVNDNVINILFDTFWILYDKKIGDKKKLENKWIKLTNIDREKIIQHVPKYKLSQPDKQYRKNPETYLNNHSWNDEIIKPFKPNQPSIKFNIPENDR